MSAGRKARLVLYVAFVVGTLWIGIDLFHELAQATSTGFAQVVFFILLPIGVIALMVFIIIAARRYDGRVK